MRVNALDHVNIITDNLEGTITFYEQLLGLARTESPATKMGMQGAWMRDAAGDAIFHLVLKDPANDYGPEHRPGAVTGAVHHVALRCEGYDGAIERLKTMGTAYRTSDVVGMGIRQIFLSDPNNISLELNFPGD